MPQRYEKDLEVPNFLLLFFATDYRTLGLLGSIHFESVLLVLLSVAKNIISSGFGAPFAINTCRNDTTSITSPFTAWEQSLNTYMLQCFTISDNSHRTTSTSLDSNQFGLICQETMCLTSKHLKAFLQTLGDPDAWRSSLASRNAKDWIPILAHRRIWADHN